MSIEQKGIRKENSSDKAVVSNLGTKCDRAHCAGICGYKNKRRNHEDKNRAANRKAESKHPQK